jgi:hypothetical protein
MTASKDKMLSLLALFDLLLELHTQKRGEPLQTETLF